MNNKKFVKMVTVSGVGDTVKHSDLIELWEEFPFVEFGIQLARGSKKYAPRFPSDWWLFGLVENCIGRGMNFSGHICFGWVKELLMGRWPYEEFSAIHENFMDIGMFQRFQINTHAEWHNASYEKLGIILKDLASREQSVIFQVDDVNNRLSLGCKSRGYNNVSVLFDTSHGAGVLPDEWPTPPEPLLGIECGYSGGLSPDNVATELVKIQNVVSDVTIWIDAEGNLRSNDDKEFVVQKARAFLEAARPFVI